MEIQAYAGPMNKEQAQVSKHTLVTTNLLKCKNKKYF